MHVEITLVRVQISLMRVEITLTLVRVQITLVRVKSHPLCENHTLRVKIKKIELLLVLPGSIHSQTILPRQFFPRAILPW
jgi:hypothetical protein